MQPQLLDCLIEVADRRLLFAQPRHPHARMLLDTIPKTHDTMPSACRGEVPNPLSLPSGCAFRPRCPHTNEHCRDEPQALREQGGTRVASHAVEEGRI